MIKGVYSSGKYMQVNGGSPNPLNLHNYNSINNTNGPQSFTGQVRYNVSNQCLEVFDGTTWQQWNSNVAQVGLTQEAEELLDWARHRRQEEVNLTMRMEQHPGLKDAYEKFKIMDVLTQEDNNGRNS
jgi:hypothetical protein